MKKTLKLLRVKHYIKNLLIFVPIIFSGQLSEIIYTPFEYILGFLSFCLFSSSIYVINDILDCKRDSMHPVKKNRPLASGAISVKRAKLILALLLLTAVISGIYVSSQTSFSALLILFTYIILNIGYSFWLKNIPIIEITILASGFLLRVIYGGIITNVDISSWLYLTILSISFYMGLGKRRNELINHSKLETRKVLAKYNRRFLDRNMYMFLSLSICFYSLWAKEQGNQFLCSIPMILIICMRYSLIIESSSEGDPVDVITQDYFLLFMGIIYISYMFSILYLI